MLERPRGSQWFEVDGSLVFADVSGFTKLSERLAEQGKAGAEELTEILNGTFTELLTVSFAEGGDLLKYGGDALLLLFRGDHHAQRACRATHLMRSALRDRGAIDTGRGKVTLKVSQGVHSGTFTCFLAGGDQRELIIAGRSATCVTDMETAADAGQILVSPDTRAMLPGGCVGAAKGPGFLLRRAPDAEPVPPPPPPAADADVPERFIPLAIRARVQAQLREAEHRYTTIGFVHVFGLDDLIADAGPEAVLERLDRLVRVVEKGTGDAGLCLISSDIAGDGTKLILTAGAPDAVEDGEGRMLSVVGAVLDEIDDLGLHAGVNAGHVFAGEVGAPFRAVYTVIGDAVNLAARLMAKAGPGELIAHRPTLERAAVQFETEPLEPFMVKGKSKPIEASTVGTRLGARERRAVLDAPFMGRDAEMALLTEVLDGARESRGGSVTLAGDAGLGKSRLAEVFAARHHDIPSTRLTCEPFLTERPYFMARLILRRMLGIDIEADPAAAGAGLTSVVERRAPEVAQFIPLLAIAVDAAVASTTAVDQITPANRSKVLAEVADTVLRRVVDQPQLFVIENAEWMDEASAALLARSFQQLGSRPWMVLLTSRGTAAGLHAGLGFPTQVIELEPLDESTVSAIAATAMIDSAVPAHELEALCARSAGNPLYLLELVNARLSAGSIEEIPTSLEDIVTARIDRLDPPDRRALRYTAVLGDRFAPRLATLAFDDVLPGIRDAGLWGRLDEFLVEERGGDLRFAHDLLRQVAYEGLPFNRRRELHERVGLSLEASGQPLTDDRLSMLSLHFDQARDHDRAWRYSREAGERAQTKYANLEAATFFERAIQHGRAEHTADDLDLAEVAEELGDVCDLIGRFDRASWGYSLARSVRVDDIASAPRLHRKEGVIRVRSGRYRAALGWYRRALGFAEALPERERAFEEAELATAYAGVRYRQGKVAECVRWSRRALDVAPAGGNRRAEAHAYYLLDAALTDLGDPAAEEVRGLALPIFEELGDLQGQANVLNNLGVDALYDGKWDEAAEHWERCRDARWRGGDVVGIADVSHNLGEMRSDQGRFDEAESLMREARRIWRAAQYPLGVAASTNGLGRLAARSGRIDDGLELLTTSLESFKALDATVWMWEVEVRIGEALAYGGRFADAADHIDRVLAAYDLAAAPGLQAMAWRVSGIARAGLDDQAGALAELDRAIEEATSRDETFESALSMFERARLGADPTQANEDSSRAAELFTRLGVDPARVVSPAPTAR